MNGSTDDSPTLMWKPSDVDKTNLDKFRKAVCDKYYLDLETYEELHAWSTERYSNFWEEVWNFTNIKCSKSFDQVIDKSLGIADIPQWFEGSRLNYAENLLKYNDDRIAAYGAREGSDVIVKRTFAQLRDDVEVCASAMRRMGVTVGDRVAGYLPNSIETIVAMLAASSIGAVWSSTSPDFGVSGVLDRFTQIKPKLIFSINAVRYNGKVHDHLQKLSSVVQGLPDLDKVVVWQYVTEGEVDTDISKIKNSCTLDEFLASGVDSDSGKPLPLTFEQLPFNHPLFIMYSSGTTGAPKCMVHSAGGTLIKHLEEHVIQGNMTRDTVMMYYTTTGWMMWNWYVTSLAAGAAIVCYDGSPLIPNQNILWDLVDKLGVTTLGTGAKWIAVLEEKNIRPKETHSLSTLDVILSTGSPLKPQSYDYVYTHIKKDLLLGSITGGTDIIACFAGQNCVAPVYRGEIQTRHLGIDLQAWDENGKPVMGESGELVCTKPFPSMPTRFWNDDDGAKYKKAYFEKFDGVWSHGDFVLINPVTKGIWMLGRSDGTLNPSGVRFGSAEIYHIVESFKEIADSLCVGQRSATGDEERVILFLKMAPNSKFDDSLVKRIRTEVRSQLSARHVPALILKIDDIPYTQNAKKVEVAVKKIISGQTVSNRGAYANPESLDLYENIPELQGF